MYIMITSKCNMKCAHCGFSCTEKGEDMSLEVFTKAAELAGERGEHIAIGGGEPTIHPQFWALLGIALGSTDESVWLSTNGSITETAIKLAKMAKKGIIGCRLSIDKWHDPIHHRVEDAFRREERSYLDRDNNDCREISKGTYDLIKSGRAVKLVNNGHAIGKQGCICSEVFVTPNGNIYECGCQLHQIGTVFDGYEMPSSYDEFDIDEPCTRIRLHEEKVMDKAELLHA